MKNLLKYEEAEISVIRLSVNDVIETSSGAFDGEDDEFSIPAKLKVFREYWTEPTGDEW